MQKKRREKTEGYFPKETDLQLSPKEIKGRGSEKKGLKKFQRKERCNHKRVKPTAALPESL